MFQLNESDIFAPRDTENDKYSVNNRILILQ